MSVVFLSKFLYNNGQLWYKMVFFFVVFHITPYSPEHVLRNHQPFPVGDHSIQV